MKHFFSYGLGHHPCGQGGGDVTGIAANVTCPVCGTYAALHVEWQRDSQMMANLCQLLNTPVRGVVVERDVIRADIEAAVEALVKGATQKDGE